VLFYLRGDAGLSIMREQVFNKNKPQHVAKIEPQRVQRVIIVDHTTHLVWVYYALGGERSLTAIDALIRAFVPRDDVPCYGVPFVLYTDQGSGFKGDIFTNFLRRSMVRAFRHETENSRATGSVEVMQNIVETRLESRFGFGERVNTLDELQRFADRWCKWFNSTQKHSRHGMTRVDAWLRITEQQLRKPPAADVLRTLATTYPKERTVTGSLSVSWDGRDYSLRDIAGLSETLRVGMKVNVVTNPYAQNGILVVTESADGKDEVHWPVAPTIVNQWGYRLDAPVIGERYASLPETDAGRATKRLEQIAYGVDSVDAAAAAKKAGDIAFAGIDPHKPLDAPDIDYLPKRGTELQASAPVYVAPVVTLSIVEAARALRERIGESVWSADHYNALARLYPEGVLETELDAAQARITTRNGLRVIAGGAA
jgi:hypothetical protein